MRGAGRQTRALLIVGALAAAVIVGSLDRTFAQQSAPSAPVAAPDARPSIDVDPSLGRGGPRNLAVALPELSPWSMFLNADSLVKAVMIGLAFASLVTWTIFLAKSIEIARAKRMLRRALTRIDEARSLREAEMSLDRRPNVASSLLLAANRELQMSAHLSRDGGLLDRVASSFSDIVKAEGAAARRGMGPLATIGATAPFVGLFGTVWGIMNSFIGISKAQTTNLAVVAPGIAEALLATAIGLVAAIPAVIIYNHFARQTKSYVDLVHRASGGVGRLVSRDLDRIAAPSHERAEV